MIRALVINLATASERMDVMARQLDHLGLDWARLEAVTPATLAPGPEDAMWQRWQRPMRVTEMALTASHMAAWQRVEDAPVLVLEDDALLSAGLVDFLGAAQDMRGVDHLSLETRGRKKLLERAPGGVWPMRQDRTGSAAYVVWPSGARALLARAADCAAPSDALISETRMQSHQAVPAQAIQFDICARYGIVPPIATTSTIDLAEKPEVPKGQGFRRRRVLGQLAMGLTALSHPRATRLHVQPDPDVAEMAQRLGGRASSPPP